MTFIDELDVELAALFDALVPLIVELGALMTELVVFMTEPVAFTLIVELPEKVRGRCCCIAEV